MKKLTLLILSDNENNLDTAIASWTKDIPFPFTAKVINRGTMPVGKASLVIKSNMAAIINFVMYIPLFGINAVYTSLENIETI